MSLEITEEMIARQPAEAQAIIRLLLAHIAQQDRRIAELETRLQESETRWKELEARWKLSPRNSSLPPSSEHPHAKLPAPKKARSQKKRGGQPGHVKHERPLIPVEQCSRVIALKPSACRRCGTTLGGDDSQPLRHQVWELPEIPPIVTEYQRHRRECSYCHKTICCHKTTSGVLSDRSTVHVERGRTMPLIAVRALEVEPWFLVPRLIGKL